MHHHHRCILLLNRNDKRSKESQVQGRKDASLWIGWLYSQSSPELDLFSFGNFIPVKYLHLPSFQVIERLEAKYTKSPMVFYIFYSTTIKGVVVSRRAGRKT